MKISGELPVHIANRVSALIFLLFLAVYGGLGAQPVTDTIFQPNVGQPAYQGGEGPVVLVDEGHYNWRTISPVQIPHTNKMMPGRLMPFVEILRQDGFIVKSIESGFTGEVLAEGSILVIGGPGGPQLNGRDWSFPDSPVFNLEEIETVASWVEEGGSLFLIAGTYGGSVAASELAEKFGLFFSHGSAFKLKDQYERINRDWIVFRRTDGSLTNHPITHGRKEGEKIDSIMTFEGQAFRIMPGVDIQPLLLFTEPTMLIFAFDGAFERAPRIRADGMLQGAVLHYGRGRVAVFGEGGMFGTQVSGIGPIGMNHPDASQNAQFILNVMHWLSGIIK